MESPRPVPLPVGFVVKMVEKFYHALLRNAVSIIAYHYFKAVGVSFCCYRNQWRVALPVVLLFSLTA